MTRTAPRSGWPVRDGLTRPARLAAATLSSICDYVYAFDRRRRFAYANPAMLALFERSADEMLGRTLVDLDLPEELSTRLDDRIDQVFRDGLSVEDEVFFPAPGGRTASFWILWGPVHADDGSVELVVALSRETTGRRATEEALRRSEARLRAATDLAGLGIFSWDPVTGALSWDDRLRAMWGLPADAAVGSDVFEAGIHPDDLPAVRRAIAASRDPSGDGRYSLVCRVNGRADGITRHIAISGQTRFEDGSAVGFTGTALDVTAQRRDDAAVRASEAQFRSFAEHSSNLIWIGDPATGTIVFRSAAFERIWGCRAPEAPTRVAEWISDVHPDDRGPVEHAMAAVRAGDVVQFEYRIVRPVDGGIRRLRDTSFPIFDDAGVVIRIGGIIEDVTRNGADLVYVVSAAAEEARRLAALVRAIGRPARTFVGSSVFLDVAAVLTPGSVLLDLQTRPDDGLSVLRELRAQSIRLRAIALGAPGADVATAVTAMKAGAVDYVVAGDEAALRDRLATALAECQSAVRPRTRADEAGARVAGLTAREREVFAGLVHGGTNKSIGKKLGISPRTVELHRAHIMKRLNATTLTDLLQVGLGAGISPLPREGRVDEDRV